MSKCKDDDDGVLMAAARALAAALAALSLPYAFAVSPHPPPPQHDHMSPRRALRVVFSRPTHESPESPVYVTLDVVVVRVPSHTAATAHARPPPQQPQHPQDDASSSSFVYTCKFDGTQWPFELHVDDTGKLRRFPLRNLDVLWQQKMQLRETRLWHVQ